MRGLSSVVNAPAAAAKSLQLCPTLCDPIDGSPPGSRIPGIFQARTLEWVAISFSNAWKWKVKVKSFSCVRLFATPLTAAYQAPPPMGFSRQEYWSGVPLPSLVRYICLPILIYLSILRWYSLISSCLKMRKPHCKFFLWICFAFTFHCFHSCLPNLYSYIMSAF